MTDAGKVSREAADAKAHLEYDRFSERRRTALESQAEADAMKQLEQTVAKLPKKKPKRHPK